MISSSGAEWDRQGAWPGLRRDLGGGSELRVCPAGQSSLTPGLHPLTQFSTWEMGESQWELLLSKSQQLLFPGELPCLVPELIWFWRRPPERVTLGSPLSRRADDGQQRFKVSC